VRRRRAQATGARAVGRQRRHARILDVAEALFAAQGFAKTTVDEIAASAGVSKGLVYDHYPSKEALLAAVWDRLVAAWTGEVRKTKFADGSIAVALGEVLRVSLEYVQANPLLRRILALDPGSLIPDGLEAQARFARRYRADFEAVLERGVRNGELRQDLDIAHTAEAIWILHFALTREVFVDAPGARREARGDVSELLRSAVELVVAGLRAPEGGAARGRGR
jgi:AcrR family transcriptional regulator